MDQMPSFIIPKESMDCYRAPEPQEPEDGSDAPEKQMELDWPRLLKWLPAAELDCLALSVQGMRQAVIGTLLGVTQTAVSARLRRVRARIRFLVCYPELTRAQLERSLACAGIVQDRDVEMFWHMYKTTSVQETARRMGVRYETVRGAWQSMGKRLQAVHARIPRKVTERLLTVHRLVTEHPRILYYMMIRGVNDRLSDGEQLTYERALDRVRQCSYNHRPTG